MGYCQPRSYQLKIIVGGGSEARVGSIIATQKKINLENTKGSCLGGEGIASKNELIRGNAREHLKWMTST